MGAAESFLIYVTVGAGVALAVAARKHTGKPSDRLFQIISAVVFWPIYLPVLLAPGEADVPGESTAEVARPPDERDEADELDRLIVRVESELAGALSSLDGWAEEALSRESRRIEELRAAWRLQAERIRAMDQYLQSCGPLPAASEWPIEDARIQRSEQARHQNLQRLQTIRDQAYHDLLGTLAWVRQLVSMIHLAKFTGEPASRAEALVEQVAAAVEGISEVAGWPGEEVEVRSRREDAVPTSN